MHIEEKEQHILIATRVSPGDRWELVGGDGTIYEPLTDALEAYMRLEKFKGEYRLDPIGSKLYAIKTEHVQIEQKTYSLYGE